MVRIKYRASILIENIVAVTIIVIIFFISSVVFTQIISNPIVNKKATAIIYTDYLVNMEYEKEQHFDEEIIFEGLSFVKNVNKVCINCNMIRLNVKVIDSEGKIVYRSERIIELKE